MHKMMELRPKTVLKMLEKTRSINDAERAQQVALCCISDAKGRKGFEDRDYPQADLFLAYQRVAAAVDSAEIAAGLSDGNEIQQAIHQARVRAIKYAKGDATL